MVRVELEILFLFALVVDHLQLANFQASLAYSVALIRLYHGTSKELVYRSMLKRHRPSM